MSGCSLKEQEQPEPPSRRRSGVMHEPPSRRRSLMPEPVVQVDSSLVLNQAQLWFSDLTETFKHFLGNDPQQVETKQH